MPNRITKADILISRTILMLQDSLFCINHLIRQYFRNNFNDLGYSSIEDFLSDYPDNFNIKILNKLGVISYKAFKDELNSLAHMDLIYARLFLWKERLSWEQTNAFGNWIMISRTNESRKVMQNVLSHKHGFLMGLPPYAGEKVKDALKALIPEMLGALESSWSKAQAEKVTGVKDIATKLNKVYSIL